MGVRPSESVDLKFLRQPSGDHSDYGPSIENCVRSLLKDERAYSVLSKKSRAKIPGTAIVVERHEDGPSILGIPLIDLANYISTLVTLAGLWLQLRDRRSNHEFVSSSGLGNIAARSEVRDTFARSYEHSNSERIRFVHDTV